MVELQSAKEKDDAPMLFIGEELGNQIGVEGALQIDIAVDPLECTNNCADNTPNSIAVLAAAPEELCFTHRTVTWTKSLLVQNWTTSVWMEA